MPPLKLPVFLFAACMLGPAAERPFSTWSQYLGGADSSQYSSLKQINKSNVKQLGMYVLARGNSVVALDAAGRFYQWRLLDRD